MSFWRRPEPEVIVKEKIVYVDPPAPPPSPAPVWPASAARPVPAEWAKQKLESAGFAFMRDGSSWRARRRDDRGGFVDIQDETFDSVCRRAAVWLRERDKWITSLVEFPDEENTAKRSAAQGRYTAKFADEGETQHRTHSFDAISLHDAAASLQTIVDGGEPFGFVSLEFERPTTEESTQ